MTILGSAIADMAASCFFSSRFPHYLFLNHIFFVINFSYFVIRFLRNSSIVKSDNKIEKVNDKENMIKKSDNEIEKF